MPKNPIHYKVIVLECYNTFIDERMTVDTVKHFNTPT